MSCSTCKICNEMLPGYSELCDNCRMEGPHSKQMPAPELSISELRDIYEASTSYVIKGRYPMGKGGRPNNQMLRTWQKKDRHQATNFTFKNKKRK